MRTATRQIHWYVLILFLLSMPALAQNLTHGPIVGGVTHESASFVFRVDAEADLQIQLSTSDDFTNPMITPVFHTVSDSNFFGKVSMDGLSASTLYYYRPVIDGQPLEDGVVRHFTTFPAPGSSNTFKFLFGSCQQAEYDPYSDVGDLFNTMVQEDSDAAFFLQQGDWGYPDTTDVESGNPGDYFPLQYERVQATYEMKYRPDYPMIDLQQIMPIDYVWDDHDMVDDNSDGTYPGLDNSLRGYQAMFPHYELDNPEHGLWHKFSYGNVDIFMIDTRTQRDPNLDGFTQLPDGRIIFTPTPDHRLLAGDDTISDDQMNWLLTELSNSTADWKFISSSVPFNPAIRGPLELTVALQGSDLDPLETPTGTFTMEYLAAELSDKWAGFPASVQQLVDHVISNNIENVIMLSGDTHTTGLDDGANSLFPEAMIGPIDRERFPFLVYFEQFGMELFNQGGHTLDVPYEDIDNAYGRVTVAGADSVILEAVNDNGEIVASHVVYPGFLPDALSSTVAPGLYDFGEVSPGATAMSAFVVASTSVDPLTINGMFVSDPHFTVLLPTGQPYDGSPLDVPGGATQLFLVAYTPAAFGAINQTMVQINTNDPDGPLTVLMSGQGAEFDGDYPDMAPAMNPDILHETDDGVMVYNGGYGSGMALDPVEDGYFYLMTDRGPNFDTSVPGQKGFVVPDFTPQIGRFALSDGELHRVGVILIRDENGDPISGLPNPEGMGSTGEIPVDPDGNILTPDPNGLDSEGLVAMPDGTFWISDEYGPHILHIAADGTTIERINPFGTGFGGRTLPQVFANRRANRGMEGLTITPDGTKLVGLMQSAMYNPYEDRTWIKNNSSATRLVLFDIASGETEQYIYLQEAPNLSNSEIRALSNTTFLVLERDGAFPGAGATYKRIYWIDISNATDVSDPNDGPNGLTFEIDSVEKTIEQMTVHELTTIAGIQPVHKVLAFDMLSQLDDYPHDKPEGFAIIDNDLIAIINDDDFGITSDNDGILSQKILPLTDDVDRNVMYFGAFDFDEVSPVVNAPIADQNGMVGEHFSFTFASDTFLDPQGQFLSYEARLNYYANDDLPAWLHFNPATRTFDGLPPHNSAAGRYAIEVSASDGDGHVAREHFLLTIGLDMPDPILSHISTYQTGLFDEGAAEIPAYDPTTQRLLISNAELNSVDILDISNPANPVALTPILLDDYGDGVNSVAVHDGLVAIAVEADPKQDPGHVAFFNTDGDFLHQVAVGALPDMLTFTPDGTKILVANEGEPNDDYDVDPEGSISIIDLANGVLDATVTTADFSAFNSQIDDLRDWGVRIFGPNATVAQDLEPEYIAVSADGQMAWATLQENNALALIDVAAAEVFAIVPLGTKSYAQVENALDASNRDDGIHFGTWWVDGFYMPDAITAYEANGQTYLITANEGDARDYDGYSEEERIKDLDLDPDVFPDADWLQENDNLGRLKTTTANGDIDGDGEYEALYAYGARSFSIWDADGGLVYDSGDDFEQITALMYPHDFNANNDENDSFDSRSDDKGPEPEGVVIGHLGDRTYAFIGLERIGGIMVYDVTLPQQPAFVQYLNIRDFSIMDEDALTTTDLGPEGLLFIPAIDSPSGQPLLVVTSEVSGTTSIYGLNTPVSTVAAHPTHPAVAPGQSFDVNIDVNLLGGDVLYGLGFRLHFDASQFMALGAEPGGFLNDPIDLPAEIDNNAGTISYSLTQTTGSGVSGMGTVARVHLQVRDNATIGAEPGFTLDQILAVTATGEEIPLAALGAAVSITDFVVWPGDTDGSGTVNAVDVLPLGQYFGQMGPARGQDLSWSPQGALPWANPNATHADATGNGVVDQNDLLPIGLNYGQTTGATTARTSSRSLFDLDVPVLPVGTQFDLYMLIGDASNPVSGVYGVSGTFQLPVGQFDVVDVQASDFLDDGDLIDFDNFDPQTGELAAAFTRKATNPPAEGFGVAMVVTLEVVSEMTEPVALELTQAAASYADYIDDMPPVTLDLEDDVLGMDGLTTLPTAFGLSQNYPNPFNPVTTIRYALPSQQTVTLRVYNTAGQIVRTLVDGEQEPGFRQVEWDGRNDQGQSVSSGVYFYRLEANDAFAAQKKMILLK